MKTTGLTELEIRVLEAARHTDFGDCLEYGQWSFSVAQAAKMDEKIYRGVVASLVKKGLVNISDNGDDRGRFMGRPQDQVFEYTDKGKALFEE